MVDKNKIYNQLRKGYTPQSMNAKPRVGAIYDSTFKPLRENKQLGLFFDMFETNEPILRAWGFLGIYHSLKGKTYISISETERLSKIISEILTDMREITYFSGDIETRVTLREHHGLRVSWINPDFVFDPVLEYCNSVSKPDTIIGELLQNLVSKVKDDRVEPLILKFATNLDEKHFELKFKLISALENLGKIMTFNQSEQIISLFKLYLQQTNSDDTEEIIEKEVKEQDTIIKKRELREKIYQIAAICDLNLKTETFSFIQQLSREFPALKDIAKRYQEDDGFKALILEKLDGSKNPHLISNILEAILVMRENVPNWRERVMENINKYQLNEPDLILELEKAGAVEESTAISFMETGEEWQYSFLRQVLINDPDKFEEWQEFKAKLIEILKDFMIDKTNEELYSDYKERKRFALRVIIDLELRELIDHCLENFLTLEDDELKRISLFAIITYGNDETWMELRKTMEKDEEIKKYVKKFWNFLECRNWEFFY